MNEFKKRVIITELRNALNLFISDEVKMRECTKSMIKSETISYDVIG